jgi:secreted trypsin-like serine protease
MSGVAWHRLAHAFCFRFVEQWILTAAHCLEDVHAVDVHLGALAFRYRGNEEGRILYKDVTEIILHDLFNADIRRNDIALIKLPVKVAYSPYIRPVVLPAKNFRAEGEIVVASGWGQQGDTKRSRSDSLNFAHLTIINSGECARELFMVRKTHVCAKGGDARESICQGDSGGPLVRKGTRLLIGIASYGDSSCEVGLPAAFIRVSSYLDWVRKHTGL